MIYKYFLPLCRLPFDSVDGVLRCPEVFNFYPVYLFLTFVTCAFGVMSKKSLPSPMLGTVYCFFEKYFGILNPCFWTHWLVYFTTWFYSLPFTLWSLTVWNSILSFINNHEFFTSEGKLLPVTIVKLSLVYSFYCCCKKYITQGLLKPSYTKSSRN